jgi:hypothetical protein
MERASGMTEDEQRDRTMLMRNLSIGERNRRIAAGGRRVIDARARFQQRRILAGRENGQ